MACRYFSVCSLLKKLWINMEKQLFFRAAMAGSGKYCTGGYEWTGVYRDMLSPVCVYM